jgi:hypothetical protein
MQQLQKNLNLSNINTHNIKVNTRISIGTNYLHNDMSNLAISYSGLGFQGHNLHYE